MMLQRPAGPQVDARRDLSLAIDQLDQQAPARGLGMPGALRIITEASYSPDFGELVPYDPSGISRTADGLGVYQYFHLPKGQLRYIGEVVTFKNYSASTRKIRIVPVAPDVIDGASYRESTTAWEPTRLKLVTEEIWMVL